jgi:hypothetical protein
VSRWRIDGPAVRRWWRTRRPGPTHTLFVAPDAVTAWAPEGGDPGRFEGVAGWAAAHPGTRARLVLSGHVTRDLLADPALPLHDDTTVEAWARHQFMHYHGAEAEGWPLAAWHDRGVRGVTALHGIDLRATSAWAAAHDVAVVSAEPWWPVALRAATRVRPALATASGVALALVEGALVTWVDCAAGRVAAVHQRWLGAATAADWSLLHRELVAGLPVGGEHLVCGYGLVPGDDVSALPSGPWGAWHTGAPAREALGP